MLHPILDTNNAPLSSTMLDLDKHFAAVINSHGIDREADNESAIASPANGREHDKWATRTQGAAILGDNASGIDNSQFGIYRTKTGEFHEIKEFNRRR